MIPIEQWRMDKHDRQNVIVPDGLTLKAWLHLPDYDAPEPWSGLLIRVGSNRPNSGDLGQCGFVTTCHLYLCESGKAGTRSGRFPVRRIAKATSQTVPESPYLGRRAMIARICQE